MLNRVINKILVFSFLLGTWLIFSGYFDAFFITLGVISCAISVYFASRLEVITDQSRYKFIFGLNAPFYILWLFKEILKSSMDVTFRVWQVHPDISPVLGWIRIDQNSDFGRTTLANSITLTPGTVCLDAKEDMLQVHSISKEGFESLKTGDMDRRVQKAVGFVNKK